MRTKAQVSLDSLNGWTPSTTQVLYRQKEAEKLIRRAEYFEAAVKLITKKENAIHVQRLRQARSKHS
jgi:hypothetical protein